MEKTTLNVSKEDAKKIRILAIERGKTPAKIISDLLKTMEGAEIESCEKQEDSEQELYMQKFKESVDGITSLQGDEVCWHFKDGNIQWTEDEEHADLARKLIAEKTIPFVNKN